ncbi:ABC-type transport system substrate-binding protein [Propionibacteriaceae bacterium ES.041]|uniref:ABC transporter substrate-binding protein n=1 Tax=Enemella evansiae TaxID=2016499 RepID=UPI000B975B39|nr:ABC transporter substrate-binding protein [Enemella evansiae]OYN99645.1 hypothetical protein CGZ96_05940 [Enemella evansiae]PFG66775.1 ABC-type transport system substrate-binding protein [Propionibacteriaceae bacterium ES.041]
MREPMRGRLMLAAVVALLLTVVGCAPVSPEVAARARAPKQGPVGQMAFQLPERATSFNPFAGADTAEGMLAAAQFQPLLSNIDGKMMPRMADRWQVTDDGSGLVVTLRRDWWSDEIRMSANDLIWTIEQHLKPENRSPLAPALMQLAGAADFAAGRSERISGLVAQTNRDVVFTLTAPNPQFIDNLTQLVVLPEHVYRGKDLSDPATFAEPKVGSGAYLFDRWESDGRVVLLPNPRVQPYTRMNQVIGVPVTPDKATEKLRDGTLQLATALPAPEVGRPVEGFRNQQAPGNRVLALTGLHGRLADPRVRQGMMYALDRAQLIERYAGGNARVVDSLMFAPDWATTGGDRYRPDQNRARDLLRAGGWKTDAPLRITVLSADPDPAIWEAMADQLSAVGVRASVEVRSPSRRAAVLADPNVDAVVQAYPMPVPDPSMITPWVSCATAGDPLGPNPGGYCNPKVDQLLTKGAAEIDPVARAENYHQVARLLTEEVPALPLWVPDAGLLVSTQYSGVNPLLMPATSMIDFWGVG